MGRGEEPAAGGRVLRSTARRIQEQKGAQQAALALAEAERVAKQHEAELLASLDGTVAVATTGQTEKARKKREKRRRQREAKRAASGGVVGGAAAARDDEPPAVGGHQAAARALPSVSGDDEHSWVAPRAPVKALRQVEHAAFPRARTNCDSGSETEMAESGEELEDAAKGGSQTPTGGGAPHWTGDLMRVEAARVASARVQPAPPSSTAWQYHATSYLAMLPRAATVSQLCKPLAAARKRRRALPYVGLGLDQLPPGMPLSELQAAQRRLAIALVLLSCPVNTASAAADLDTDVLTLLGDTLTEHCTLGPRQHLLCCQALKTLSNGWGRCRHVSPPPGFAARLERTISDFRKSNTDASKASRLCRVAKELRIASMDGGGTGVAVALREDGDIFSWEACIAGPPSSPYAGGLFFLDINLPADYPFNPPNIKFTTSIYHCNVKADGYITADSLDGGHWSPATTAWKALISIQALLSDPNPEDGCCDAIGRGELGDLCRNDRTKYDETARDWTRQHAVIIPGSV